MSCGLAGLATSTTTRPAEPAATYATVPTTSTLLAKPGMLTNPSARGVKVSTTIVVVVLRARLVAVTVAVPGARAVTNPSASTVTIEGSLET